MNEEIWEIKGFLRGLFWGIILSVGALVFFETEKGQKLKKKLEIKGEDLLEEIEDLVERAEKKSQELLDSAQEVGAEIKEKAEENLGVSLSHIEALQEHGREISSEVRTRFFKNIPKKKRAEAVN